MTPKLKHNVSRIIEYVSRAEVPAMHLMIDDQVVGRRGNGIPDWVVRFSTESAVTALARDPSDHFPDLYCRGEIEVEGDMVGLLVYFLRNPPYQEGRLIPFRFFDLVHQFVQRRSRRFAASRVSVHYDYPPEFFAPWLGSDLVYTCGFFPSKDASLESAQSSKIDRIFRKLCMDKSMRLLDIGCGWGAVSRRAAEQFNADVTGISISKQQIDHCCTQALHVDNGSLTFNQIDYRDIPGRERFDRAVCIGMFEHVGAEYHGLFMKTLQRLLVPGGLAVIQSVMRDRPTIPHQWIATEVFPGVQPPSPSQLALAVESAGLKICDVEALGKHYALTLGHWSDRFQRCRDSLRPRYSESFLRSWSLYLWSMQAAFKSELMDLWQVVLLKPPCPPDFPLTLTDAYVAPQENV
jgi:cyclopropane-fatty-acyl-phospholipid synthase